ncbi:uncharacterized protein LOC113758900 [Coffea eugenioides]|uniref:uncharacterized protein LOC113758900 n=1 Tax=Coffea eugenioides TaxID=49369 RepID=UPI000F60B3CF|nr:uncharacterized protein LOC113758900 [Coffea eugenioides]
MSSYPDEVVLAVDDERRSLSSQLEEAREVGHGQAMRIRDLERGLRDEMQRVDALRRQLQDTQQHLFALKRQLKERVQNLCPEMDSGGPSRAGEQGRGSEGNNGNGPDQVATAIQRMADLLERMTNQQGQGSSTRNPGHNLGHNPELVLTEQKRIRRFTQGLNVEIQEALAAAQLDTFSQALEKVQRIETARGQVKAFHDRKMRQPSSNDPPVSHRPCRCWYTYSYPDEVVLAVDDERRSLISQLEEAREVGHGQAMRIRDLERGLRDEMQRADALRRQLQDTHQHLFAVKRQLKERVRSISMDCEVILDMAAEAPSRATGPEGMDETCAPKWTPVVKVELESKDEALKEIMEMDRIKSLQPSSGWPIY